MSTDDPTSSPSTPASAGADAPDTTVDDAPMSAASSTAPASGATDVSALNQQIVQAVDFSNARTAAALPQLVSAPPEIMTSHAAGLAVQDAASYMNSIMQIALAAQAVIAKKAAEGPAQAAAEAPALLAIQQMVTAAVAAYGTVSTAAAASAQDMTSGLGQA